jgi:glycosyltransferase involved in cell wall biosynthesis
MKGVSLIICCYNSSKRLGETLKHLSVQQINNIPAEIIVVDNASTDNTAFIARQTWDGFGVNIPLRIINESKPGLSHAREAGINASSYSYVIFCDDDNWLEQNYIATAFSIMESDSQIGASGGMGIAETEIEAPDWFEECKRGYACGSALDYAGELTENNNWLVGAGLVIRKSAWITLKKAGFETLLTDRTGTSLSSGGDLELCMVLKLAGYKLWNDNRLVYQHFIPKERLTEQYFLRLIQGCSVANVTLDAYLYVLNGWNYNKSFLWLRIYLLNLKNYYTNEKPLKEIWIKSRPVSEKAYRRELFKQGKGFKQKIISINNLKQALQKIINIK